MKNTITPIGRLAVLTLPALALAGCKGARLPQKPNIIYLMFDASK